MGYSYVNDSQDYILDIPIKLNKYIDHQICKQPINNNVSKQGMNSEKQVIQLTTFILRINNTTEYQAFYTHRSKLL